MAGGRRFGRAAVMIAAAKKGYDWVGEHADDIDRAVNTAVDKSRGTRFEIPVQKTSLAVKKATAWARKNDGPRDGGAR